LVFENKLKIKESMVLVISKNLKELPGQRITTGS
jgi:hypothetical protein